MIPGVLVHVVVAAAATTRRHRGPLLLLGSLGDKRRSREEQAFVPLPARGLPHEQSDGEEFLAITGFGAAKWAKRSHRAVIH